MPTSEEHKTSPGMRRNSLWVRRARLNSNTLPKEVARMDEVTPELLSIIVEASRRLDAKPVPTDGREQLPLVTDASERTDG